MKAETCTRNVICLYIIINVIIIIIIIIIIIYFAVGIYNVD